MMMIQRRQQQHRVRDLVYLLRGPIIGTLILLSVLIPTLLQLSWTTLIRGLLFLTACCLALYDGTRLLLKYLRQKLQQNIHKIVLDDVLCAIFHPQTGILSVMAGMFLGNAALYSFPTTVEQRVQLVQHALDGTGLLPVGIKGDKDQNRNDDENDNFSNKTIPAHEILLEPGGFLRLAPAAVQDWFWDVELLDNEESDGRQKPQKSQTVASTQHHKKRRQPRGEDEHDENSTASETSSVVLPCHSEKEPNGHVVAGKNNSCYETPVRHPPPEDDAAAKSKRQTVGAATTTTTTSWSPTPPRYHSQSPARHTTLTNTAATTAAAAPQQERQQLQQQQQQQQQQLRHPLPLPHEIVKSILQDWTAEHVRRLFQSIPDASLETICVVATTLLCLQFRYSRRARELLWSTLQASTAVGGTTALLISVVALVTKHRLFMDHSHNNNNTCSATQQRQQQTTNHFSAAAAARMMMTTRSRNACREAVCSSLRVLTNLGAKVDLKKWQGILAAIVLFYFGRRTCRRSSQSQPPSVR